MKLMEEILSEKNLKMAIKKVKQNKGALGVDKMTVQEVEQWFEQYREELISKMMNKQYRPMPVKRVYIPKPNGKQRPLGIPTVVDESSSRPWHRFLIRSMSRYSVNIVMDFDQGEVRIWRWKKQ